MSAQPTNEELYWRAYCQIIKSKLQPKLGPNSALFFCTETVRCIPAADWIPQEVTNLGIFFTADALLDPSNPFYVPNRSNGYIKSLETYLSWVDLGGSKDEGVIARYISAQTDLQNAQEGLSKALDKALKDYDRAKAAGLTTDGFPTWAATNAAAYNSASQTYQGVAAQADQKASDMNGELAPQWSVDKNRLAAALYSQVPITGVTMGVTNVDSNQLNSQLGQALAGNTPALTPATAVYQKGAYSLAGYAGALKNWLNNYSSYVKNPQSAQVSLSDGRNFSFGDIGFSNASGSGSFSWLPFISFGASFNNTDTRDVMSVENSSFNIDMQLTYGDVQTFTVNPGNWDIGSPKSTYPTLREGAPPQAKNLVRPVQLLCGTAIGLKITFSGGAERVFDSKFSQYRAASGGVRIFGFNVGLDASFVSQDTQTTHIGTWDGNSGTFTVKPVDGAGWCTLLGVLGEKLT